MWVATWVGGETVINKRLVIVIVLALFRFLRLNNLATIITESSTTMIENQVSLHLKHRLFMDVSFFEFILDVFQPAVQITISFIHL